MGNHDVGRSMASSAELFWHLVNEEEVTPIIAKSALDIAAKPYIGADAEFDDEFIQPTPLSKLISIAFEATETEMKSLDGSLDDDGDAFYEGPYRRFSDRYKFC